MDMSKLPRLSQTDSPPTAEEQAAAAVDAPRRVAPLPPEPASFAEVWIGVVVGLILLMVFPTMIKYLSSRLFGTSFAPFMLDGKEVPYPKVYPQFFSDLCITLFALVLIVEGLALVFVRKRWLVAVAFTLTAITTGLNILFVVMTMGTYGLPIVSVLAVAFGVYITAYQWRLLKAVA